MSAFVPAFFVSVTCRLIDLVAEETYLGAREPSALRAASLGGLAKVKVKVTGAEPTVCGPRLPPEPPLAPLGTGGADAPPWPQPASTDADSAISESRR